MQHARLRGVQGVAAAGIVHGVARMLWRQPVIDRVVHSAKTQGGAELIALGGVVVDHIENHLDARRVQSSYHAFEFAHRMASGRIARVGGEIADGAVTPVVAQAPVQQVALVHKIVDRQQLHCGHAQRLEVIHHRPTGQTGIGPTQMRRHVGMAHGEAAHVQFVDQGVAPGDARRSVIAPHESGVHHLTLGHSWPTVAGVKAEVFAAPADPVAKLGVAPVNLADNALGVRIE